jgi:hypothetical protein
MRSLPKVAVGRHLSSESENLENYRSWVGDTLLDEIRELSRELKGLRICNINATAAGESKAWKIALRRSGSCWNINIFLLPSAHDCQMHN